MPRKPKFPKGVQEGLAKDLAASNGAPGSFVAICEKWHLTENQAANLRARLRDDINEQRQAIASGCMQVGSQLVVEISRDLADPDKMAETPLRDKAMALDKVINAGVTAAEGHQPQIKIDFGSLREGRQLLEQRDRKMKEMRSAKTAEVV